MGPLLPHQLLATTTVPEVLPFSETRVGGTTHVSFDSACGASPRLVSGVHRPAHRHFSPPFQTLAGSCGKFAPFEIKENMVLAPCCRTAFDQELLDQLDQLLLQQDGDFSFLKDLKGRQPLRSGPTMVSNRGADIFNRSVSLPWVKLARLADLWVPAAAGPLGPQPGACLPGHGPWLQRFVQLPLCFHERPKSLGCAPGAQAARLASWSVRAGHCPVPAPPLADMAQAGHTVPVGVSLPLLWCAAA